MVRWLPPKGGGAETPGRVANSGRTRFSAKSCISPCVRVGAAEDQLADGDAAGVEARDERRHRARRHEGAGAVHVADGFGHRLAHVGALVKDQLHERRALDALALDVIDAGDVEEVILVVVSEVAFHLRRIHAAVGLGHIDRRIAHLRKDDRPACAAARARRRARSAIRATTTVMGLLSAARTRRMAFYRPAAAHRSDLGHEGLDVSCRGGDASNPRHTPSRARASSISAWVNRRCASATSSMVAETRLVSSRGLLRRGACRRDLHGSVGRDPPGAVAAWPRHGSIAPGGRLRSARTGRSARGWSPTARPRARVDGWQIEHREGHAEAEGVILHVRRQAVQASEAIAVGLGAGPARVCGGLQIETAESRTVPGRGVGLRPARPRAFCSTASGIRRGVRSRARACSGGSWMQARRRNR